jgi:hypothetical protein
MKYCRLYVAISWLSWAKGVSGKVWARMGCGKAVVRSGGKGDMLDLIRGLCGPEEGLCGAHFGAGIETRLVSVRIEGCRLPTPQSLPLPPPTPRPPQPPTPTQGV